MVDFLLCLDFLLPIHQLLLKFLFSLNPFHFLLRSSFPQFLPRIVKNRLFLLVQGFLLLVGGVYLNRSGNRRSRPFYGFWRNSRLPQDLLAEVLCEAGLQPLVAEATTQGGVLDFPLLALLLVPVAEQEIVLGLACFPIRELLLLAGNASFLQLLFEVSVTGGGFQNRIYPLFDSLCP